MCARKDWCISRVGSNVRVLERVSKPDVKNFAHVFEKFFCEKFSTKKFFKSHCIFCKRT